MWYHSVTKSLLIKLMERAVLVSKDVTIVKKLHKILKKAVCSFICGRLILIGLKVQFGGSRGSSDYC